MSRSSIDFDEVTDAINLGSPTGLGNIFTGGGTVSVNFNARDAGESGFGRIWAKGDGAGHVVFLNGTDDKIVFFRVFSTTNGGWSTDDSSLQFNTDSQFGIIYTDDSVSNDPIFVLDGVSVNVNEDQTPVGAADNDSSLEWWFGSTLTGIREFDGTMFPVSIWDRALSVAELIAYQHGAEIPDGLVSFYQANEGAPGTAATSIVDVASNRADATDEGNPNYAVGIIGV